MQLTLGFLETPTPLDAAPVWDALDDDQRAVVVLTLARLIAKLAAVHLALTVADEEPDHA